MSDQKTYLGDRTKYLGASDWPALMGVSKYKSYDMLVAEKKGLIVNEITDRFYVDRGDEYEDDVLARYEKKIGKEIIKQFEAIHSTLQNKAHFDGLIPGGAKDGGDVLIEVKSKTIPKEYTNVEDYMNALQEEPPIEYILQMVDQFYLGNAHAGLNITECKLIIGLYKGRSIKRAAEMILDVTEHVAGQVNIETDMFGNKVDRKIDRQIKMFWNCVEDPEYVLDAKTTLEVSRYNMKKELEERKLKGTVVYADAEDRKLIAKFKRLQIDLFASEAKTKKIKSELSEIKEKLIIKYPDATSIGDDFNKLIIEEKLDSGRYTPAKNESVVPPKFKKVINIG